MTKSFNNQITKNSNIFILILQYLAFSIKAYRILLERIWQTLFHKFLQSNKFMAGFLICNLLLIILSIIPWIGYEIHWVDEDTPNEYAKPSLSRFLFFISSITILFISILPIIHRIVLFLLLGLFVFFGYGFIYPEQVHTVLNKEKFWFTYPTYLFGVTLIATIVFSTELLRDTWFRLKILRNYLKKIPR